MYEISLSYNGYNITKKRCLYEIVDNESYLTNQSFYFDKNC